MEIENFEKAVKLQEEIKAQNYINHNAKNQRCERIVFAFGNSSNSEVVCYNIKTINEVRELIIKRNQEYIDDLEKQFKEL